MCSHISLKERSQIRKAMLQKWGHRNGSTVVKTHFTTDRNCNICLRTKIRRVPWRRRDEGSFPRAEKFGDLITADHTVLNEGSKSRNNRRHAVVVQDLATRWIQSHPCKTKSSHETARSLSKILGVVAQTDSCIYRQLAGIWESMWRSIIDHRTSTSHRSETSGTAQRAVRRVKEGTSAVWSESGLDERWWAWFCGVLLPSAKRPRPLGRWENSVWKTIWRTILKGQCLSWEWIDRGCAGGWIPEQSSIRCRGKRSRHSMDTTSSV